MDQGELQRYLASIAFCPPILLNHAALNWTKAGPLTLRVQDQDACPEAEAMVDLDLAEDGGPLACRAERPRLVGKQSVLTPWMGKYLEFQEWEGLRVAARLEVSWQLPENLFTYFRSQLTSFTCIR